MNNTELKDKLSGLSFLLDGSLDGRASVVKEDGIYLVEQHPAAIASASCLKIYPHLSELREDKDFICACVKHFAVDYEDDFLSDLCKWFAGCADKCPVLDLDLFYIPGDFHKEIIFFDGKEPMSREKLISTIEKKFRDGYVLDHTKMKCDRIAYIGDGFDSISGNYDSIIGEYLPCLVTNDKNEVAIDYFERDIFSSLTEQIGISSFSECTLDFIQTPYLHHILHSMVLPCQ